MSRVSRSSRIFARMEPRLSRILNNIETMNTGEDLGQDVSLDVLWEKLVGVHRDFVHVVLSRSRFLPPSDLLCAALQRVKVQVHSRNCGGPKLYDRLLTELKRFQEPGAESAPDYTQQGVSGLWRGDTILIEDAEGYVLGLSPPDEEADHFVFYGRRSKAEPSGESREVCPWYDFRIRHEDRKGMLAGKDVIFWYDQDMRCMNKWPRHRWCRMPDAQEDFLKTGLLSPPENWKIIGHGGYGRVVCEAEAFDGSKVAIKVVQIVHRREDFPDRRLSEKEAELLYSLDHPHLIACYVTFVVKKVERTDLYIVMELADLTLESYLYNHSYNEWYLDENEIWKIFIEILLGVNFLHINAHRILHRGIRLRNILRVRQQGKEGKFDNFIHKLARVRGPETESMETTHYGMETNHAPEQRLYWRRKYTEKTDIFQLGLVGHYCCFLRHPYAGQFEKNHIDRRIDRIDSKYSKALHKVIHGCLHLTPERRASTLELLANPRVREKGAELGLNLPDPIASKLPPPCFSLETFVGLIKLDFSKPEIAVFTRGKLRLEYPSRCYLPAMVRKALYPLVSMEQVDFGSSSYIFGETVASRMSIQFKCVCVSKGHDQNLQLTLRHLSSIVGFVNADGYWHSPVNIYLNGEIVSENFRPRYWRDYVEDTLELPSDGVLWDGSVNVVEVQLSKDAKTRYWLQGCNLEIRRRLLDVGDHDDVTRQDAMNERIWVLTRSACIILAITMFLMFFAFHGTQDRRNVFTRL